jgi:hypothetical protein
MSCDCCCKKTLNLCSVSVCDDGIDLGITAQVDGVHKMIVDFLGVQYVITQTFAVDDKIIFPVDRLNERFTYSARVYEPDGKQVLIEKSGVTYDCFKFKTTLSVTV